MRGSVAAGVLALAAVLDTAFALTVTTATPKLVQVARGQNATLVCNYVTTAASLEGEGIASWKRGDDEVITVFFGKGPTIGEAYTGRVAFSGQTDKGDLSISISQLKMEDNGTYKCQVEIMTDRKGTTFDKIDLVVLVAPSKPKQSIAGTVEYGQVITLTCNSEEGSPVPTYTWSSYTVANQLRPLPPTAVADKGTLTLKNISVDTSGFYFATVKNIVGQESCNITVSVLPPSMDIAFYAGIIGGSIAAIIAIGIIAYCCCCRDRKDEDYEMDEREEEEAHEPLQEKPRRRQDDDDDDDRQRAGPPMPPTNKPQRIEHEVDA